MGSAHRILSASLAFALAFSAVPASALSSIGGVSFFDSQHGFLGGGYGQRKAFLSATSDGGATWHAVSVPGGWIESVDAQSATAGWATSSGDDVALSTVDAGASWRVRSPIIDGRGGSSIADVDTFVDGTVVAVGKQDGVSYGDLGTVHTSANGGTSWTKRFAGPIYPVLLDGYQPLTYARMNSLAIAPGTNTGWAIGAEWRTASPADWKNLLIYKTVDSGSTWTTATVSYLSQFALNDAVAVSPTHAYACGANRAFVKTTDGTTWTQSNLERIGSDVGPSIDGFGIDAIDASRIVVVGSDASGVGTVQWTTNAGATWPGKVLAGAGILRSVDMIDSQRWIAVGDDETIARTADGGATWTITRAAKPSAVITSPVFGATITSGTARVDGTAADVGVGVTAVELTIRREDNLYWNGSVWVAGLVWNPASTLDGWDHWTYSWGLEPGQLGEHSYTLQARATDAVGQTNLSAPVGAVKVTSPPVVVALKVGHTVRLSAPRTSHPRGLAVIDRLEFSATNAGAVKVSEIKVVGRDSTGQLFAHVADVRLYVDKNNDRTLTAADGAPIAIGAFPSTSKHTGTVTLRPTAVLNFVAGSPVNVLVVYRVRSVSRRTVRSTDGAWLGSIVHPSSIKVVAPALVELTGTPWAFMSSRFGRTVRIPR